MNDLLNMFYVQGNFGESFFRLIVLVIMFDCLLGFAKSISSIKGSVS